MPFHHAAAWIVAPLFAFLILSANCSKTKALGAAIPADAPVVVLADILASPGGFDGKKVVLKGIVSAQCPSLCEFTFKQGTHAALIFPQGFKFPKLEVGKPVTLYALITSGDETVVVTALGLKSGGEGRS